MHNRMKLIVLKKTKRKVVDFFLNIIILFWIDDLIDHLKCKSKKHLIIKSYQFQNMLFKSETLNFIVRTHQKPKRERPAFFQCKII